MNAHSPQSSTPTVEAQALALAATNADVLRAVRDGDLSTPTEVARATGRAAKNMSRDVGVLIREALLAKTGDAPYRLTAAGQAALMAVDIAQGRLEPPPANAGEAGEGTGVLLLRHEQIRPNPLNPRKAMDEAAIANLAETIAEDGDLLQNLVVFPADAEGVHLLAAGERRWRAVGKLIAEGRWPENRRLRAIERENTIGQTSYVALVENGQRENLTLIEQARAYLALVEETGWSAREAALKTGRDPRSVQEMLKVLREADPADIARHEAGDPDMKWEDLRNSVKRPAEPEQRDIEEVTGEQPAPNPWIANKVPLQRDEVVALVEIVARYWDRDRCHPSRASTIKISRPYPYSVTGALQRAKLAELITEPRGGGKIETFVAFLPAARDWLMERGMWPEGGWRAAALSKAYALRGEPFEGRWATYWLNEAEPSPVQAPLATPTPALAGGGASSQPVKPPRAPAAPDAELNPVEQMAMIELAWKVRTAPDAHDGSGVPLARVHRYWLDAAASQLTAKGLVVFTHTRGGPHAGMPKAGRDWIDAHYPNGVSQADREWAQDHLDDSHETGADGFITPWLNVPASAAAPEGEAPEPEPEEVPLAFDEAGGISAERSERLDAEDEAASRCLDDVSAALDHSDDFDRRAVFERSGIAFPLAGGIGEDVGVIFDAKHRPVLTLDPDNQLPDAQVRAQVLAIVTTLNAAVIEEADVAVLDGDPGQRRTDPVVPIRRSITPETITCLEDGRKFASLTAHLRQSYGLTPDAYRARWGLPADYPMVAPNVAHRRYHAGHGLWSR